MPRASLAFRQRAVTRAVKGVRAAGVKAGRVIVEKDGRIIVEFGEPDNTTLANRNEWDEP
jgi:hypothetical protein